MFNIDDMKAKKKLKKELGIRLVIYGFDDFEYCNTSKLWSNKTMEIQ